LPGAGLLGLSRAWMSAGAGAVVATLWPVPDAPSAVMEGFYRELPREAAAGAPEALRRAQLQVLRRPGAEARPADWAQFFVMGKE
jgi:CHAT domain-containing protein